MNEQLRSHLNAWLHGAPVPTEYRLHPDDIQHMRDCHLGPRDNHIGLLYCAIPVIEDETVLPFTHNNCEDLL